MSDPGATNPQAAVSWSPENNTAPNSYGSAANVAQNLLTRYGITVVVGLGGLNEGQVITASQAVDQQGPFLGVKVDATQERQWPRSFRYGWPNVVAAPTSVMIVQGFAGIFPLDYEGVVPQQILDWVSLECWRYLNMPFERAVSRESLTGASVTYDLSQPAQIDVMQDSLIRPFQVRVGHRSPFPDYQQSG